MEKLIDSISNSVPHSDSEYVGQDGLLYCAKCGGAVQTKVEFLGVEKVVRCICKCKKAELEAFERQQRKDEYDRKRRACFAESNMAKWNFETDDGKNEKLTNAMKKYVENFDEFKAEGRGLLLHGPVGTGKSFMAACVANALIDDGYRVLMTSFSRLTKMIQATFDGKQKIIDSLNSYQLLIIDDLGAERKSEFMQETVFDIIDARYRSGLPFIITTNLTTDEIKKPQEIGYSRIYDRILERCFPVEVAGRSRRRQKVADSFFDTKEKLGL